MIPLPKNRSLTRFAVLFLFVLMATTTKAQTVVYKWSSNAKEPESFPRITTRQTVTFNITEVNDILYSYRIEVTETRADYADFDAIKEILTRGIAKSDANKSGTCEAELTESLAVAMKALRDDPLLPLKYEKLATKESISLRASLAAWSVHSKTANKIFSDHDRCGALSPEVEQDYKVYQDAVIRIQQKAESAHVFSGTAVIGPGSKVSTTVFESFGEKQISSKTFTFSTSDVLTLSAGALFSRIPDRTYEGRKSPSSTLNVLTVEGDSRATPALVALLNYHLKSMKNEFAGVALSAGPVIRLGSNSNASSFGFFSGVSANLYNRFFITPGFHFGQFSDFPVGFGNGSTVPANFGELTPVKRWTARFALAITFKTKDFSGLTSSDKPKVTGTEGDAEKKEPPKKDGGDTGTAKTVDVDIARPFFRAFTRPINDPIPTKSGALRNAPVVNPSDPSDSLTPIMTASTIRATATNRVSSLRGVYDMSGERIRIAASAPIQSYSMFFRGGRFYLVLPQSTLDSIGDDLSGHSFSDAIIERRSGDLIVSFSLSPGTKASVVENASGLDVLLMPAGSN